MSSEPSTNEPAPLRPLNKPHWLPRETFEKFLATLGGAPRCVDCGTTENLSIDHIVARHNGGPLADIGNLCIRCVPHNSQKGTRPDEYWSRQFYWDRAVARNSLRAAQRGLFDAIVTDPVLSAFYSRPMGEIAGRIGLLVWVVGAGKTLGIPTATFALNHLRMERWGATRRADRILVLTKERALRDQIAADLERDLVRYGIATEAPRVARVTKGEQWSDTAWLNEQDVVVACIHQLYERRDAQRDDLPLVLALFPYVFIDEPHFAPDQVRQIVDKAHASLVFGLTGTPITGAGQLLNDMVLVDLFTYDDAVQYDQSLKYVSAEPAEWPLFVETVDVSSSQVLANGRAHEVREVGYESWQLEATQNVGECVVRHLLDCDKELAGSPAAPHRDPERVITDLLYYAHGMVVYDTKAAADEGARALNRMFEANRARFPRRLGWEAKAIHTEGVGADGELLPGAWLNEDHAWLRSHRKLNRGIDEKCARVLCVVGMGREGTNNPLTSVVGLTCDGTVQELVQRPIGRQLRAVTELDNEGVLHVPPALLDTVKIVVHPANDQSRLRRAVAFVCNMAAGVDGLPTIESLMMDGAADAPDRTLETEPLTISEKLRISHGIVCELGPEWRDLADTDDGAAAIRQVVRSVIGDTCSATPSREHVLRKAEEWTETLRGNVAEARRQIAYGHDLPTYDVVLVENEGHAVTADQLRDWTGRHHPELAALLEMPEPGPEALRALRKQWAEQIALPPARPDRHVSDIRQGQGMAIWHEFEQFVIDASRRKATKDAVFGLTGSAIKQILGVPDGESATDNGKYDTPQVHVILNRPEIRKAVTGWVRDRLIEKRYLPTLAAMYGIAEE